MGSGSCHLPDQIQFLTNICLLGIQDSMMDSRISRQRGFTTGVQVSPACHKPIRSHTTEENLPQTASPYVDKLDLSPKACASPPILRRFPRDGSEPRKSVRMSNKVVEIPMSNFAQEDNDQGTDEVDGLGENLEKLEAEESDIVKEPEGPREDSSLKRGASKISRALDTLRLFKDGKGRYKGKK